MGNLSEKELRIIEKYCGHQYVKRCQGIMKRQSNHVVRVANTGMVSSGKSSLFNILTDNLEEEKFPTGAARTTTIADYCDYNNISFIDTPGIDVRSEDDEEAFRTIMEADIIMMVHNIKTGPLNRSEAEWLEQIVRGMNDTQMCQARLIFICTWKDTRERDEDYTDILADIKNQVYEIVGTEIAFFDVSVKKYLSGVSKGKEKLIEHSGILDLKKYIEQYADNYLENKQNMDALELETVMKEIQKILGNTTNKKRKEIERIEYNAKATFQYKYDTWKTVFHCFSEKRKELSNLKEELDYMEMED